MIRSAISPRLAIRILENMLARGAQVREMMRAVNEVQPPRIGIGQVAKYPMRRDRALEGFEFGERGDERLDGRVVAVRGRLHGGGRFEALGQPSSCEDFAED